MSSAEGPNTASTGSMSSTEPRVQAVAAVQTCGILPVTLVSTVSTPVVPAESSLLQLLLVAPSVNMLCKNNGHEIIETVHTWSKHTSYAEYTAHIEFFFVLRVRAVRAVPTDEMLPVFSLENTFFPGTGSICETF